MVKQIGAGLLAITLGTGIAWFATDFLQPPKPEQSQATSTPLPEGGNFTLQSIHGPVSLSDFHGKVVVLYFGYTACPDICPTSMATLKGALNQLTPEEILQVQGIMVSVDPERDTLEHTNAYAQYFHPNIIGITGKQATLQEITRRYNAFYHKVAMEGSSMGYTIDHSAILYVIDKAGNLREQVEHAVPPAQLADAIRRWL